MQTAYRATVQSRLVECGRELHLHSPPAVTHFRGLDQGLLHFELATSSHQRHPNIVLCYPFKNNKLGLADIRLILEDSGLGLPSYYEWRSRSGCYFCFYQQIGESQGLKERHPDWFERAKTYEVDGFTWVEGRTLDEIAALPKRETIPAPDMTEGCAICHL